MTSGVRAPIRRKRARVVTALPIWDIRSRSYSGRWSGYSAVAPGIFLRAGEQSSTKVLAIEGHIKPIARHRFSIKASWGLLEECMFK